MRYRGATVPQVGAIPSAANQWFYDSGPDTLYLWLPDSSNPNTNIADLTIIDWRPLMEEIIRFYPVAGVWTWQRLGHHRSHYTDFSVSRAATPTRMHALCSLRRIGIYH